MAMQKIQKQDKVHEEQDFGNRNDIGGIILNFTLAKKFELINIFYKKREKYLITFKSENNRTLIDYFMVRKKIQIVGKFVRLCQKNV